jgi:hypothetical protein
VLSSFRTPPIIENRHEAELPENPANIALSGQNRMLINGWAASGRRAVEKFSELK